MIEVADKDGARRASPLQRAVEAIVIDGKEDPRKEAARAETRAYAQLARVCVRAGSTYWIDNPP